MAKISDSIVNIFGRSLITSDVEQQATDVGFLLENLPHIVFQLDASYHWVVLNPCWERTTGFQREECLGQLCENFIHPGDRQQLKDYFTHLQPGRRNNDAVDARLLTRHKEPCWAEIYAVQIIDSAGQAVIVGTMTDISDRIAEEEVLHANHRSLSGILNDLSGMIYRCRNDKFWTMEYLSGGCLEMTGYPPADIINNSKLSWDSLIHPEDHDMVWAEVQDGVREHRYFDIVYRMFTINKIEKWVWERGKGIFSDDGELLGLEGSITDITESKSQQDKLALGLLYDSTSGLPQQPLLKDRLKRVAEAKQAGIQEDFCLLVIQFHRLAVALERYGWEFEEEVTRTITSSLLTAVKPLDSVTRMKSDRYAILLENITDQASVRQLAQQVLEIMRSPVQQGEHTHFLTCSIGAANDAHGCETVEAIINAATVALDYAAAQGGSRFELYDPEYVSY